MDLFSPRFDELTGGNAAAGKGASTQRLPADRLQELEDGIERLLLITEAMWTLLREQHGYDEQELVRRIAAIDMRDGKYDNRVAKAPPKPCPKCNRMLGKHRAKCLYCGEPIVMTPFDR
jgi:hypothetical protein